MSIILKMIHFLHLLVFIQPVICFFAETIWNDVKRIKNIYKKRVKLVMFSFA